MPRSAIRSVGMSERRDEQPVRIPRIHLDIGDHLRIAQSEVRPGLAGVGGFVHAVADRQIGADDSRAGADVNDVGIRRAPPRSRRSSRWAGCRRAAPRWSRSRWSATRRRYRSRCRRRWAGWARRRARARVRRAAARWSASAFRNRVCCPAFVPASKRRRRGRGRVRAK